MILVPRLEGMSPPVVVARVTRPLRRVPSLDVSFRTVTSVSHIYLRSGGVLLSRGDIPSGRAISSAVTLFFESHHN